MQIIQAARASAILYSILVRQNNADPWLLPANVCPIVPITFLKAHVPFKFVDISARTLQMDLEQAETLIRKHRFGGLLYVHAYGELSTPNGFFESIRNFSPNLLTVDDRCLCVPDLEPDAANQADVQLYSTGYAKVVELNVGGYAFLGDNLDYQPAHLSFDPQAHDEIEKSYKSSVSQRTQYVYHDSDWLDTEIPRLPWHAYQQQIRMNLAQSLEQRASLNRIYTDRLPEEIQLPGKFQTWRFNIRVKNKQCLLDKIFSAGLFASSHYASLAGIMGEDEAPHADDLAGSVINLFNDRHFTLSQAEQVCSLIVENLAGTQG